MSLSQKWTERKMYEVVMLINTLNSSLTFFWRWWFTYILHRLYKTICWWNPHRLTPLYPKNEQVGGKIRSGSQLGQLIPIYDQDWDFKSPRVYPDWLEEKIWWWREGAKKWDRALIIMGKYLLQVGQCGISPSSSCRSLISTSMSLYFQMIWAAKVVEMNC